MAKRYAVLGPKNPSKKKTIPGTGYAPLPGTFKHKVSLPSSKNQVSSAVGNKSDLAAKKSPKAPANDGPKKDRYLALGDPTDTSDSSSKGGHQTGKGAKDSEAVKGHPRRRRIKVVPFTLSVGAGVLCLIAVICILIVLLTGEEMKLINLDQYCRSKYGPCAYYRNKLIDDCSSTKDYCSSVEINPDLLLQKKKVDRFIEPNVKSEYTAQLVIPVWRRGHGRGPLVVPNGAPCDLKIKNGTIGWCVKAQCTPMDPHQPTTIFTSQTTTNGQWSSFGPLDQLNFSCFNIAKEPKIKYEQLTRSITNNLECEKSGVCRNYSLVIRTCTEPRPAFGGQFCHSTVNLLNGSEYLGARSLLRWRVCACAGVENRTAAAADCTAPAAAANGTKADVCHFSLKTNEYSVNLAKIEPSIQWTAGDRNDWSPCCDPAARFGFCLAGSCVPMIDKTDD